MEPRIQYAQTEDGVSIAFWTLGEGMPLIQMPLATVSHLELEWHDPEYRAWYERLSQERMLVRYDGREAPAFRSEPLELQLHLGIHAGDVIREGNNVYGEAQGEEAEPGSGNRIWYRIIGGWVHSAFVER